MPDESKLAYLQDLVAGHVDSFNFGTDEGLAYALKDILAKRMVLDDAAGTVLKVWLEDVRIARPSKEGGALLYPSEARERHMHYGGKLTATVCVESSLSGSVTKVSKTLGMVPVMVRSQLCNLSGLGPRDLIARHEDATELGGYFICNGIERCIRVLQIPRRNHMMAMQRSSFQRRGPLFSDKAVSMRCVGPDQTGHTLTLHYLVDGTAQVKLGIRKAEYFIPVVLLLRALKQTTDLEIYTSVLRGAHLGGDTFISDRCELSLAAVAPLRLFAREQCLAYLGSQFRAVLYDTAEDTPDEEVGRLLLRKHVLVHLESGRDKFAVLIEMMRKLYAFVAGQCGADNADALNNHEMLMGGHLMCAILKERLDMLLVGVRGQLRREHSTARTAALKDAVARADAKVLKKVLDRQVDVGKKLFYFMSTGNLVSESALDLMQVAGFTIVADKLNRFRYLSHFRSVHRGQFFTTMKTTAVRKLLPESWGFLCPVHTPDGAPCGLLNHMAAMAGVVTHHPKQRPQHQAGEGAGGGPTKSSSTTSVASLNSSRRGSSGGGGGGASVGASLAPTLASAAGKGQDLAGLVKNLVEWGVLPAGAGTVPPHTFKPVMVDGRVVGHASEDTLRLCEARLRRIKVAALRVDAAELVRAGHQFFLLGRTLRELSRDALGHYNALLEVTRVPEQRGGAFAGLFLGTHPARMLRPVVHLESGLVELIGPMEQTFLEIAVRPEEVRLGVDTHCELWPTSMLSLIASLTPFSDFNQSPRNMYQAQMGKQTMGTPAHNLRHRPDNKLYRILFPQAPIVQNVAQGTFMMDEYPHGANAVVAVISYTGYDMEDAMILNKSSYERGFGHARVYKTKLIDLTKEKSDAGFQLGNVYPAGHDKAGDLVCRGLGLDGLPSPGETIRQGQPLYCTVSSHETRIVKHKDAEEVTVEHVRLFSPDNGQTGFRKASITLSINRNPVVGDKFSSRHGQKGVLSILWPQEDMPFSESGMSPDVIINPHAFPSRMTIGMLVESMAGKAGALHGCFQESTPFTLQGDDEGQTAVDYFGQQLRAAGYNYHGSEPLYSGLQGTIMKADIYIGVVYYQRLRHMVSDKSQVRSLGPIDQVTRQPVKGRKRGGGVRFGEMERDSLLAHGTAFIMRDRLLNCSDRHVALICCGSMLAVSLRDGAVKCQLCGRANRWHAITVPYVFRFLCNELAAMGIKLEMS